MGALASTVKTVLGFAGSVVSEKDREANRKRQKAAAKLKNPILPPFFYRTLDARKIAEDTGKLDGPGSPYTIPAIRVVLKLGILPSGYSEEQLEDVGFGPETKLYQIVLAKEDARVRKDLARLIDILADGLETNLDDLEDLGVTMEDLDKLRDVAARAKMADPSKPDEMIDIGELSAVIDRIKVLSGAADDVSANRDALSKLNTQEAQASSDRTDAIVDLARAAYATGLKRQPT